MTCPFTDRTQAGRHVRRYLELIRDLPLPAGGRPHGRVGASHQDLVLRGHRGYGEPVYVQIGAAGHRVALARHHTHKAWAMKHRRRRALAPIRSRKQLLESRRVRDLNAHGDGKGLTLLHAYRGSLGETVTDVAKLCALLPSARRTLQLRKCSLMTFQ